MAEKQRTAGKGPDDSVSEAEAASVAANEAFAEARKLITRAVGLGNGENAFLLKRIAHCADGYRTNSDIHILMQTESPYTPKRVFRQGAQLPTPGKNERLYGPFKTQEPAMAIYKKKRIDKVTVHFEGGDEIDVTEADALFWRMSAVEKFCLPWYASQYGIPVAYLMWDHYANSDDIAALCHDPRSVSCDIQGRVMGAEQLLTSALLALAR